MKLLSSTVFCAVLLAAAPAFAADHQMRVTEVLLSGNTNAASQFVELSDPGEGFPASYNVVVYDTAGVAQMAQSVALMAGTTRVMLANSAAQTEFGLVVNTSGTTTPIFNLAFTLPAVGSVCFRRQDGGGSDNAGTRIHCLGWGNANSFPVSSGGTDHGGAPPAGMSLQRYLQCTLVGPPSPNATNTGTCPLMVDAPPPIDAMPPDADTFPPDADDGNGNNGKGGGGCNVDAGPGWLGGMGLAGLAIAGGVLRRRKRYERPLTSVSNERDR